MKNDTAAVWVCDSRCFVLDYLFHDTPPKRIRLDSPIIFELSLPDKSNSHPSLAGGMIGGRLSGHSLVTFRGAP